jgi:hypothetical protein
MADISERGIYKKPEKKIRMNSKKQAPPSSSLRRLAGGWTKKEADEFLESFEPFDLISKTGKK